MAEKIKDVRQREDFKPLIIVNRSCRNGSLTHDLPSEKSYHKQKFLPWFEPRNNTLRCVGLGKESLRGKWLPDSQTPQRCDVNQ